MILRLGDKCQNVYKHSKLFLIAGVELSYGASYDLLCFDVVYWMHDRKRRINNRSNIVMTPMQDCLFAH